MKRKINIIFILVLLVPAMLIAQPDEFNYRRKIEGITNTWHTITIPADVFGKLSNGLSDIRIYGFLDDDTVEAPYILKQGLRNQMKQEVRFKLFNQSHSGTTHYCSFKVNGGKFINSIDLSFNENNFDIPVILEGSNDQRQWYTILDKSRLVSINEGDINFTYSSLHFKDAKYKYYRIHYQSKSNLKIRSASVSNVATEDGMYTEISPSSLRIFENKKEKTTVAEISLPETVPVSCLSVDVGDDFDYYRPFDLERITDSVQTSSGWLKYYSDITSGIVSSVSDNEFWFNPSLTNRLRLVIHNDNNQPLKIRNVRVKRNIVKITARFNPQAKYYIYYGDKKAGIPDYDITMFRDKIPADATELTLGSEEPLRSGEAIVSGEKSIKKYWLWMVMGIIVIVLGLFTIKMIKASN